MDLASDLIYILAAALLGGLIAQSLRQPLILGYILAGILVGPYTAGPTVERIHDIEMLADIGVALLLFTLGLEFSFGELKRLARITLIGTPLQIFLCSVSMYLLTTLLGYATSDALWIAGIMSVSSTMVVLKTLTAKNELQAPSGQIMLGILIAQDVAVFPLILILPQLASETINYTFLASAAVRSLGFLLAMYIAGTRIIPRLFEKISRAGSQELFFIATLGVALGAGLLAQKLGLSFALGAFVAGMVLSDTVFNHQALSDISSLRDLFSLIFFVSVGMLFDPSFFINHLDEVILMTGAIVATKALVIMGIVRLLGFGSEIYWAVGLGLSQIGEFGFVIASAGSQAEQLSDECYSLMIAVAVLSMVSTPALFWIGRMLAMATRKPGSRIVNAITPNQLHDHVVIIGGGVVGQYIARVFSTLELPYVVIESDYKTATRIRDQELTVIFGDGSHRAILETGQTAHARLIAITTTNGKKLPGILSEVRRLNSSAPVVVRVAEVEDIEALSDFSVHEFVQPQLEAGLEIINQSLLALGRSELEISAIVAGLRDKRHQSSKKHTPTSTNISRHLPSDIALACPSTSE